jgi:hypothetical protein
MSASPENDSSDPGQWYMAEVGGSPVVGAYLLPNPNPTEAALTVFWRGYVPTEKFRRIVARAEGLFTQNGQTVQESLVAFGPTREPVGPLSHGLASYLEPSSRIHGFDAYRAEFEGSLGKLTVWANVTNSENRTLAEGGENIGICVNPLMFKSAARPLISEAIHDTQSLDGATIEKLLDEISSAMLQA